MNRGLLKKTVVILICFVLVVPLAVGAFMSVVNMSQQPNAEILLPLIKMDMDYVKIIPDQLTINTPELLEEISDKYKELDEVVATIVGLLSDNEEKKDTQDNDHSEDISKLEDLKEKEQNIRAAINKILTTRTIITDKELIQEIFEEISQLEGKRIDPSVELEQLQDDLIFTIELARNEITKTDEANEFTIPKKIGFFALNKGNYIIMNGPPLEESSETYNSQDYIKIEINDELFEKIESLKFSK